MLPIMIIMEYPETDIGEEDPVEILKKDRELVRKLKEENSELKEKVRKLFNNNRKLVELIELMEEKIKKMTDDMRKRYIYSYEEGGWIEKEGIRKERVEIEPAHLTVDAINNQLSEILRLIERYKISKAKL